MRPLILTATVSVWRLLGPDVPEVGGRMLSQLAGIPFKSFEVAVACQLSVPPPVFTKATISLSGLVPPSAASNVSGILSKPIRGDGVGVGVGLGAMPETQFENAEVLAPAVVAVAVIFWPPGRVKVAVPVPSVLVVTSLMKVLP